MICLCVIGVFSGCAKKEIAPKESPLKEVFASSDTVVAKTATKLAELEMPLDTTGFQGGYTDGRYYYQTFIRGDKLSNEIDNDVYIVKYDLKKQKVLEQSESMKLNHANDLTYNSKLGYFVVAHTNPNRYKVSFIDPKTLTIVKTVALEYMLFSIDYNEAYDRYVVGIAGGKTFRILDSDFKNVGNEEAYQPSDRTDKSITQGMCCDDSYIYFALYDPNIIAVYDWDGNFITIIELSLPGEPENITVIDDKIYVTISHESKAQLYLLEDFEAKDRNAN